MRISRRAALISLGGVGALLGLAGGGIAMIDAEVLPGRSALNKAIGLCDAPVPSPSLRGVPQTPVVGSFRSARRRRQVSYAISYPPGYDEGAHLPVCLALHGYATDGRMAIESGDYPQFIAGAVHDGAAPFALAGVDGGDGYWHPHGNPHAPDDPLDMLVDEFLPLLAARGLDTDRVAVAGWSMGGYGALLCGLTWRTRFRLIVATSPAIFHSYADARKVNPGAFGSLTEWNRYDIVARADELAGLPVRIAIGAADPFAPAVEILQDRLSDPSIVDMEIGCHDNAFWSYAAPAQVKAISLALSD
jgi:pimeloyl-ACP methyl ester carboxylesterase